MQMFALRNFMTATEIDSVDPVFRARAKLFEVESGAIREPLRVVEAVPA